MFLQFWICRWWVFCCKNFEDSNSSRIELIQEVPKSATQTGMEGSSFLRSSAHCWILGTPWHGSSLENHSAVATTPFQLEGIYGAATQRIHCMLKSPSPSWICFQRYFMKLWSLAWFRAKFRKFTQFLFRKFSFIRPPAFGGFAVFPSCLAWRSDPP